MVIDSSAVIAILRREPEMEAFIRLIAQADIKLISAISVLECHLVSFAKRKQQGSQELDRFLDETSLDIISFDRPQLVAASEAFVRFGKGNHPAGLNFGDCCSYALAGVRGLPLLYKGDDFARTDIVSAVSAS